MGIKQVIVDDFDGVTELPDGTEPEEVTYKGKKYKVYMSTANGERFLQFLSGTAPLSPTRAGSSARATSGSRQQTNTYGHDYADVKEWAIAQGMQSANGTPVTESTRRLGQHIYDAYHQNHKAK